MDSVDFSSQEIVQQLADGNWAVTRILSSGIHKKDFRGTLAGKEVHIETDHDAPHSRRANC